MNQIALIADIHGNLPALEAVEKDIKSRGIKDIYCLGDMCGRGPGGKEAIEWCRENCNIILAGNWDIHIANGFEPYAAAVGAENIVFLKTLPLYHRLWISGKRMHLFHGRPLMPKIIYGETAAEEKLEMFAVAEDKFRVDMVGYADIHRQFKTDFKDDYRVLFNTGSVGNSFCTPTACYAVLRGVLGSREPSSVSVEFVSIPYDNQKAVENVLKCDWFPRKNEYIKEVTTGTWQPGI